MRVATGGTPAAFALQDKVSQAWINFARTGNPSQPGLDFKPYTVAGAADHGVRHCQRIPRSARR